MTEPRQSFYRQPPPRPGPPRGTSGVVFVIGAPLGLIALIAALAHFGSDVPAGYAILCGAVPVALGVLLVWFSERNPPPRRTPVWDVIARKACPRCSAELGIASLYVGAEARRIVISSNVGVLTLAHCTSCRRRSLWNRFGDLDSVVDEDPRDSH